LPKEKMPWAKPVPKNGERLNPDKTGYRTGIAPPEEVSKRMLEEARKAKDYIHKKQAESKVCLT